MFRNGIWFRTGQGTAYLQSRKQSYSGNTDGLADEVVTKSSDELAQSLVSELFTYTPEKGNDDRTCLKISVN